MAQRRQNKKSKVAEEEPVESVSEAEASEEDAEDAEDAEESEDAEDADESEDTDESEESDESDESDDASETAEDALAAREELDEEAPAATQLGSARYVLAGFFALGMLSAYVFGRALETVWQHAANKDWFSQALPVLAAVPDETKATYGLLIGAIIAFVVVYRTYRKPDIRSWADDVAAELAKVKWPTRKEVSSSTMVVIAASTVATLYLALLDRFWSFLTNIVYGGGS